MPCYYDKPDYRSQKEKELDAQLAEARKERREIDNKYHKLLGENIILKEELQNQRFNYIKNGTMIPEIVYSGEDAYKHMQTLLAQSHEKMVLAMGEAECLRQENRKFYNKIKEYEETIARMEHFMKINTII